MELPSKTSQWRTIIIVFFSNRTAEVTLQLHITTVTSSSIVIKTLIQDTDPHSIYWCAIFFLLGNKATPRKCRAVSDKVSTD